MLTLLFWLSVCLVFYIYLGYPLVVGLLAKALHREVVKDPAYTPSVSILIAAYNEAADIEATIRNKLRQNYPAESLEILVVSDESDDGTDDIVEELARDSGGRVRLVRQVPRQGKTAGLNLLVPLAKGDIILFSDANSRWEENAVGHLVANFADPEVGYVTGKMVYVNPDGSLVGDGCSAYMNYENWLRERETLVGSVVGVDGGVDGMRRELYQDLRADQLPDFVQPLKVVEQGYRVVYEPAALLTEDALSDGGSEFSMRVRVSLRAMWALKDMKHLMNPMSGLLFAWQMISHKLLRYAAFIPLVAMVACAFLLAPAGAIYGLAALGCIGFLALALAGHLKESKGETLNPLISLAYYFLLLNVASYRAALSFLRGEKKVIWNPRKG